MKIVKILTVSVIFLIGLSSCSWKLELDSTNNEKSLSDINLRLNLLNNATDEEIANEKISKIVEYINSEDEESLQSMFSKRALEEAEDFTEKAEQLFEFIDGDVISWEQPVNGAPGVSTFYNHGKTVKEVDSFYNIETETESYFFLLNDFPVDEENSNNEGINMLLVVREENHDDIYEEGILYKDGKGINPPGIYLPIQ